MLANGYQPIPLNGKAPIIAGWQKVSIGDAQVDEWAQQYSEANVGIRTGQGESAIYAFDLDIYDPDVVLKVEESVIKTFGKTIKRIGQFPKVMLLYRGKPGASKIQMRWEGGHGIEILGDGQQFVAYGIHPDTKRPYEWIGDSLDETDISELPEVDMEKVSDWVNNVAPKLVPWLIESKTSSQAAEASHDVLDNLNLGLTEAQIRVYMDKLDPDAHHDDWRRYGAALHHETHGSELGKQIWLEYCRKGTNYGDGSKKAGSDANSLAEWGRFNVNKDKKPYRFHSVVKLLNSAHPEVKIEARKVAPETYTRDDHGHIHKTLKNISIFLKPFQLRFDTFRDAFMIVMDGKVRPLEDEDFARLQVLAEQEGFKIIGHDIIRQHVMRECKDNKYDSGVEWAQSLSWDGVPRCETLFSTYFGAEDTEYTRAAAMYITSAMGGRLMEVDGCKADAAIVIVGLQGAGKTETVKAIAPNLDTFVELNMRNRDDNLSRSMRGKLVGELAELRGIKSAEAEDIKAWVSRIKEEWIPKFKEFAGFFTRRLTLWGTTNEREFLNDYTGNRRWIPITAGKCSPAKMRADHLQIWAEAIAIYKTYGVMWEQVDKLVGEIHAKHYDEDPLIEDLRNYLTNNVAEKHSGKVIWEAVRPNMLFDIKAAGALKRAMVYLGWKPGKVSINKVEVRGYKK